MKLGGSLNQHRYNKIMKQSYKNNFVTNVEIKLLKILHFNFSKRVRIRMIVVEKEEKIIVNNSGKK